LTLIRLFSKIDLIENPLKGPRMVDAINTFATFIALHATELALGLVIFLAIAVLILLIVLVRRKPGQVIAQLQASFAAVEDKQLRLEDVVKDEIDRSRQDTSQSAHQARQELRTALKDSSDSLQQRLAENVRVQNDQLDSFAKQLMAMTRLNEEKMEAMRKTMETQLRALQEDSSQKLEQMRATVDEKLQSTLEKRLGESFKQVSERLEQVYKGLGEMRTLASGVGDLKRVLTNVKTSGVWGEIRLSHILEQILTPDQYDVNVATRKNSNERVEFAVRLPGPDANREKIVWLPIDSKFPQVDYQRLLDAQENADKELTENCIKNLEARIKAEAKNIKEKYIDPPYTTDFGIMFLPVEGLYAEVLRRPGLCDDLQRNYRIVVTGPTTLAALLNSLQMGFRTLAIEKRSSEVWELLGAVKTEFGKFGDALAKTKKKLQEASHTIDQAAVRSRAIERQLQKVEQVPQPERAALVEENDSQASEEDQTTF
jgi:DNA recombination protein RmuC